MPVSHSKLVIVELAKLPYFPLIDKQAGVPKAKAYAVLGLTTIYLLLICFNVAGSLLTNLLGFLYPAYASFKAIESKHKDDDTQWLTYWCVFGFFNVVEFFADIILYWLPFYFLIKAGVILFMIMPQFGGATNVYYKFFRPVLLANMSKIDAFTGKAAAAASGEEKKE